MGEQTVRNALFTFRQRIQERYPDALVDYDIVSSDGLHVRLRTNNKDSEVTFPLSSFPSRLDEWSSFILEGLWNWDAGLHENG